MGLHEKSSKVEGVLENSENNRKWVIINLRTQLKPINTIPLEKIEQEEEISEMEEECSTTPRGEGTRIPTSLICPPAPKKRKSSLKFNYLRGGKEFFTPPELESVFIRHVQRAI
ncbi:cyclin-dependent protein kinase inhibitor SMR6-like [Cicer arietinum]|uniref:Cyclin-dependent protein kinase inhibitor SMR6-like n=1 Tax=Cicer arietinum TaxID=3827 RepID=A0A1S2XIB0_CICAR|nr:cyclin-dependent protein kinase inhibitor SMR6-like [Cicer arietinum]